MQVGSSCVAAAFWNFLVFLFFFSYFSFFAQLSRPWLKRLTMTIVGSDQNTDIFRRWFAANKFSVLVETCCFRGFCSQKLLRIGFSRKAGGIRSVWPAEVEYITGAREPNAANSADWMKTTRREAEVANSSSSSSSPTRARERERKSPKAAE